MSGDLLLAHGVGRVYELPIPLSYYLFGAAATVLVSFLLRALAQTTRPLPPERPLLGEGPMRLIVRFLRGLAVLLLLIALIAGIVVGNTGFTFTTLAFWVGLVVGTTALSSIVGGFWEISDPWATTERFYRLEDMEPGSLTVPWWVGPVAVFALFWFELVSGVGFDGFWVVVVLIGYSVLSFAVRSQLGERWSSVDPLSILFGFAARLAPLRLRETGLSYKGMLRDLEVTDAMPKALFASVFVLLASTTFDNIVETVGWTSFLASTGLDALPAMLVESVALLVFTLPFLITFMVAVTISHRWFGRSRDLWSSARRLGWSLIPIGVAYVLAHNAPLLMTGFPQWIRFASDPFERGWNLLGTSGFLEGYSPSPKLVWFLEIGIIVGGHIVGVLAAHRAAVRLAADHRAAVRSQYALTALMATYTIATLWLLSRPLVV